jgi:hypothetical protein
MAAAAIPKREANSATSSRRSHDLETENGKRWSPQAGAFRQAWITPWRRDRMGTVGFS